MARTGQNDQTPPRSRSQRYTWTSNPPQEVPHGTEIHDTMIGCGLMIVMLLLVVSACNAVLGSDEPERESTPEESPSASAEPTPTSESPSPVESASEPAEQNDDEADMPDPDPDPDGGAVYYDTCADARDAGAAPLYAGDPGYRPALDRDKDGDACE